MHWSLQFSWHRTANTMLSCLCWSVWVKPRFTQSEVHRGAVFVENISELLLFFFLSASEIETWCSLLETSEEVSWMRSKKSAKTCRSRCPSLDIPWLGISPNYLSFFLLFFLCLKNILYLIFRKFTGNICQCCVFFVSFDRHPSNIYHCAIFFIPSALLHIQDAHVSHE